MLQTQAGLSPPAKSRQPWSGVPVYFQPGQTLLAGALHDYDSCSLAGGTPAPCPLGQLAAESSSCFSACTPEPQLRCMEVFPEDGRPYVSLGKLLVQQRRYNEALALYEEGCTATGAATSAFRMPCPASRLRERSADAAMAGTCPPAAGPATLHAKRCQLRAFTLPPSLCPNLAPGGTNAHIWAAWAYLAAKLNNVGLARKLYDAAIVANPQHAAAWHGWGLLEKEQGNYLR